MAEFNSELRTELNDMDIRIVYTAHGDHIEYDINFEEAYEIIPFDGKETERNISDEEFDLILSENLETLESIVDDAIENRKINIGLEGI